MKLSDIVSSYLSCARLIINFNWINSALEYSLDANPISVKRALRGSSQSWGRLEAVITNQSPVMVQVIYVETMPWLLQFYLHTLEARVNGTVTGPSMLFHLILGSFWLVSCILDGIISNISYIPPVARSRPATFQLTLNLPPQETVMISMDVTKAFLRYTEHPPDAQRGWDLPPAIITPVRVINNGSESILSLDGRIYTSALLVDLATPDFSMPYNVIIFTCSLIAFIFGSVFNLLTRKFVVVRWNQDGVQWVGFLVRYIWYYTRTDSTDEYSKPWDKISALVNAACLFISYSKIV